MGRLSISPPIKLWRSHAQRAEHAADLLAVFGRRVAVASYASLAEHITDLVVAVELLARLRRAIVVQDGHGRARRAKCGVARTAQRQVECLAALDIGVIEDRDADLARSPGRAPRPCRPGRSSSSATALPPAWC